MSNWPQNYKNPLGISELGPGGMAESLAKNDDFKINTRQLRKFLSMVRKIRNEIRKENGGYKIQDKLARLYPMLAYSYGRKLINEKFYNFMKESLKSIETPAEFENFYDFLKAVIAYRKLEESREEK